MSSIHACCHSSMHTYDIRKYVYNLFIKAWCITTDVREISKDVVIYLALQSNVLQNVQIMNLPGNILSKYLEVQILMKNAARQRNRG